MCLLLLNFEEQQFEEHQYSGLCPCSATLVLIITEAGTEQVL